MDSRHPRRARDRALLAASLAVAIFWSGAGLARTQPGTDSDDTVAGLQALEAPGELLTVTPVDHVPVLIESAGLAADADTDDMPTPLISLTPRAETALREIFADEAPAGLDTALSAAPSSPVAETDDIADLPALPDEVTPAVADDEDVDLPMLQRRMFRIDI